MNTATPKSLRLPDFIIGGAPRSGTTWLYALLDRHPGVYMAKPVRPEPKFFHVDELYARGVDYYARTWFADVPPGCICGEKSANYLEHAPVAERIHTAVPGVKLIFILREPAARAYSNYLWTRMNGMESESFETALAFEAERELAVPAKLRYARPYAYYSRGLYADLLKPFFDRFPREQILCLKFEDIVASPEALAHRLYRFLGVSPPAEAASSLGVINAAEGNEEPMPVDLKKRLQARYAEPNQRLSRLLGPSFDVWVGGGNTL